MAIVLLAGVPLPYRDDCRMFKVEHNASLGVGMRGMNERVRQLGWELKVSSGDKGMSIRAIISTAGSSSIFARAGS